MLYQASPVYPSLESELVADTGGELADLLKTTSSRILHIQCPSGADRASEMVRNYLVANRVNSRMLLYFRFSAHDARFNNMQAMLTTFVAQIVYSQLETMSSSIATVAKEFDASKTRTTEDMFYTWDFLRGDSCELQGPALVTLVRRRTATDVLLYIQSSWMASMCSVASMSVTTRRCGSLLSSNASSRKPRPSQP